MDYEVLNMNHKIIIINIKNVNGNINYELWK